MLNCYMQDQFNLNIYYLLIFMGKDMVELIYAHIPWLVRTGGVV